MAITVIATGFIVARIQTPISWTSPGAALGREPRSTRAVAFRAPCFGDGTSPEGNGRTAGSRIASILGFRWRSRFLFFKKPARRGDRPRLGILIWKETSAKLKRPHSESRRRRIDQRSLPKKYPSVCRRTRTAALTRLNVRFLAGAGFLKGDPHSLRYLYARQRSFRFCQFRRLGFNGGLGMATSHHGDKPDNVG